MRKFNKFFLLFNLLILSALKGGCLEELGRSDMSRYNYVWSEAGKSPCDSMPIGNGDLAANVYTEVDSLCLLLSKNDAFDSNGDSIKTGRVRVKISPNPFDSSDFKQTLSIADGAVYISSGGVSMRIWADANNPLYRLQISADKQISLKVKNETWKRRDFQDVQRNSENALIWFHTNPKSPFLDYLNKYRVAHRVVDIEKLKDPFLNHTVANLVESDELRLEGDSLVGSGRNFDVFIHSRSDYTSDFDGLISSLKVQAERSRKLSDFKKHKVWWSSFWDKSYIIASNNDIAESEREKQAKHKVFGVRDEPDKAFVISQHYNVQRYMMACQARGDRQVQFNGGLFTVPMKDQGKTFRGEDDRRWGRRYTFQNQRLLYWPMIHAGDYDLMKGFFDHYMRVLPIRKAITKMWFGIDGAYYRENIQACGDEIGDGAMFNWIEKNGLFEMDNSKPRPPRRHLMEAVEKEGSQEARPQEYIGGELLPNKTGIGDYSAMGYHNFHFNSGLEISYMAIEYYRHTLDDKFLKETLIPFAREILLFFDKHYPRDSRGKLLVEPGQAIETYWYTRNATTEIAGLRAVLSGLLEIRDIPAEYRSDWERFLSEIPEVATRKLDNGTEILAPAELVKTGRLNGECPELYAAFPYEIFGVAKGNEKIVKSTMPYRSSKNGVCWNQDEIFYAYAGIAKDASNLLFRRFSLYGENSSKLPMFSRAFNDYIPDLDNNGSGSIALQKMLIQEAADKIVLLPAWPKNWDCKFKLRANKNTVISGEVKGGKLRALEVSPKSRLKDIVQMLPQ